MPSVTVSYSRAFLKKLSRLPQRLVDQAQERETIFRENPFDSRLETHKLHGDDRDAWAFSINRRYRIKFIFLTATSALFLDVGTHDIYR